MMHEFTPYEEFLDNILTELISNTGPKVTVGLSLGRGNYSFSFHYFDWKCRVSDIFIKDLFVLKTDPKFNENLQEAAFIIRSLAKKEIVKLIYSEDN